MTLSAADILRLNRDAGTDLNIDIGTEVSANTTAIAVNTAARAAAVTASLEPVFHGTHAMLDGDTATPITVTGVAATDYVIATVVVVDGNSRTIRSAKATENTITITFSGAIDNDTEGATVAYLVFRPAA